MQKLTKDDIARLAEYVEKRKREIRNSADIDPYYIAGNTYYISSTGDDGNDGLSPQSPWKTIDRVSEAALLPGDCVRFRRNDIFRGSLMCKAAVTYTAYGEGNKPRIYGWTKNLADPNLWYCVDEEHRIWKCTDQVADCGTLVFNDGQFHSRKLIPSFIKGRFVCRDNESKLFEFSEEMTENLDVFCYFVGNQRIVSEKGGTYPVPTLEDGTQGDLYLRCDEGNPGAIFKEIEAVPRYACVNVCGNPLVHIDNLCLKYACFGITGGPGHKIGLHVTNCEIGWIGGNLQHYTGDDPNYPEGTYGSVTRYGNGIEIYGGCDDYHISNCYVYDVYDAAMSHQISTFGKRYVLRNVKYLNNVIERCVYGIEYFLDKNIGGEDSYMDDIEMAGNIILDSGYGWGQQRHNKHTPAHIKGWNYENTASNYFIHDNILGRAAYRMIHLVAENEESCPKMYNNTYVQDLGATLGQYGSREVSIPEDIVFDEFVEDKIKNILGEESPKVYCL